MKKRLKVLIYGDTLVLGCLRASLAAYEGLDLASIEVPVTGEQELRRLDPDVVLFDLEAAGPAFQHSLAVRSPDLLLVGVDSAANRVLTWTGRQLCQLSTAELVQMMEGATSGAAPAKPWADAQGTGEDFTGLLQVLDQALDELSAGQAPSGAPRPVRALTRIQKLAFGLGTIVLAAVLVIVLAPGGRPGGASLLGVAVGGVPARLSLAFVAGLLFGALTLGLWRRGRQP